MGHRCGPMMKTNRKLYTLNCAHQRFFKARKARRNCSRDLALHQTVMWRTSSLDVDFCSAYLHTFVAKEDNVRKLPFYSSRSWKKSPASIRRMHIHIPNDDIPIRRKDWSKDSNSSKVHLVDTLRFGSVQSSSQSELQLHLPTTPWLLPRTSPRAPEGRLRPGRNTLQ